MAHQGSVEFLAIFHRDFSSVGHDSVGGALCRLADAVGVREFGMVRINATGLWKRKRSYLLILIMRPLVSKCKIFVWHFTKFSNSVASFMIYKTKN